MLGFWRVSEVLKSLSIVETGNSKLGCLPEFVAPPPPQICRPGQLLMLPVPKSATMYNNNK